ncbi:MAG: thiamine phosphate synthase [Bacteroidota bacterium]|nr:thiamine phosphate synthase [Bacteroidota bacterium]
MLLILISPPETILQEHQILISLFNQGLQIFHLRKPDYSEAELETYILQIPEEFHTRIVIHSHYRLASKYNLKGIHLTEKVKNGASLSFILQNLNNKSISASFHAAEELTQSCGNYNYIFLSPIFDSISKYGYKSRFNLNELKQLLSTIYQRPHPPQIVALGGISEQNIHLVKEAGFNGIALLGTIWQSSNPLSAFQKVQAAL